MSRLDLARIMCRCIEDGDCLLWTGKTYKKSGAPAGTEWVDGKDRYVGVRRRAYEEYHGVTLDPGQLVTCTCTHPGCLRKDHLDLIDVGERNRRSHAAVDAAAKLRRSRALSEAAAWRRSVPPDQVETIRNSEEGPYITAKKLGVNGVVASRIRRGVTYRDYTASPWAGLGS